MTITKRSVPDGNESICAELRPTDNNECHSPDVPIGLPVGAGTTQSGTRASGLLSMLPRPRHAGQGPQQQVSRVAASVTGSHSGSRAVVCLALSNQLPKLTSSEAGSRLGFNEAAFGAGRPLVRFPPPKSSIGTTPESSAVLVENLETTPRPTTSSSSALLRPSSAAGSFAAATLSSSLVTYAESSSSASSIDSDDAMDESDRREEEDGDGEGSDDAGEDLLGIGAVFSASTSGRVPGYSPHAEDGRPRPEPSIFFVDDEPGPSASSRQPGAGVVVGPSLPVRSPKLDEESGSPEGPSALRRISDHAASQLIYERELAAYGGSTLVAADVVNNGLIDVSVDQALGPNIRQNLLRNLSTKTTAPGLPLAPNPAKKGDPKNKLAKRKHQITHLAHLAVAREEQLQEKWAENKQKKRMSSQRYGF